MFCLVGGFFLTCIHEWIFFNSFILLNCEQTFPLGKSIIKNSLELLKENSVLAGNLCVTFQLWRCDTSKPFRGSRNADRLKMTAMTVSAAAIIWFKALASNGFIIVHLNISEVSYMLDFFVCLFVLLFCFLLFCFQYCGWRAGLSCDFGLKPIHLCQHGKTARKSKVQINGQEWSTAHIQDGKGGECNY